MAEYIDREVAVKAFSNFDAGRAAGTHSTLLTSEEFAEYLYELPTADVAPVVHGHWETSSDRPDSLICSVCKCGFDMWKHDPHNYCPNCGAKMDEEV